MVWRAGQERQLTLPPALAISLPPLQLQQSLARGGQVFVKGHSPQGKGLMARDHLLQLLRKIKLLHAPDC